MNFKKIVGILVVVVLGGFLCGCTDAPPTEVIEVEEFAEVDNVLEWEEVEVIEAIEVIEVIETTPTPTPFVLVEPPKDVREYYTYTGVQRYAQWEVYDTVTLYLLETGEDIAWYYQMNIFDCSEMSAAYERAFENAGYNAKICVGFNNVGGHAWVAVEKEDGWLFFEATAQQFFPQSEYMTYYDDCFNYADINEAMEDMPFEFNWWFTLDTFDSVEWI